MNKRYAIIIAFLITGLLFSTFSLFSLNHGRAKTIVARVIDGDTLEAEKGLIVRLININAPEKDSPLSDPAKLYLSLLINKTIELEIIGRDKYNRILAKVYAPSYINMDLVKNGLASKFLVEKSELKDFAIAEKKAILNGKGIWEHSQYFGCFTTYINKYEEVVSLINKCSDINMLGWILKDESRKTYIFSSMTLGEIKLYSGKGNDSEKDLFWNSNTHIWNDDRDTLYLFDEKGRIAHYEVYGY